MPLHDNSWFEITLCLLQLAFWIFPGFFEYIGEVYGDIAIRIMIRGSLILMRMVIIEFSVNLFKRLVRDQLLYFFLRRE